MLTFQPGQVTALSKKFSAEEYRYEVSQAIGAATECADLLVPLERIYLDVTADPELRVGLARINDYFSRELENIALDYAEDQKSALTCTLTLPPGLAVWSVRIAPLPDAEYQATLLLNQTLAAPERAATIRRFASHLYDGRIVLRMADGTELKEKASVILQQLEV
jgi:hypothetical protein